MLHKLNPFKARLLLVQKLKLNSGNVKRTARQLKTSPLVVRKWRDRHEQQGEEGFKDLPHIPRNYQETELCWEDKLLVEERRKTNYGRVSLNIHMQQKYQLSFSDRHIRTVLKNAGLQKQRTKRSKNGERRVLYYHDKLLPFQELQVDTKHILDQHALPADTYDFIRKMGLPCYQWTAIDIKTRIRFLAWSHSLNATYGKFFIELITLWMRAFGVQHKISIQLDNGLEFCMGSKRKEKAWNEEFVKKYNMQIKTIPAGLKYMQGYVERSHRFDDEWFYVPRGIKTKKTSQFLLNGFEWQCQYNLRKTNRGEGMNGLTPIQKLKSLDTLINPNIVFFPPFRLENLLNWSRKGGNDVPSRYRLI